MKLKEILQIQGLDQKTFAEMVGITSAQMSEIANNKFLPTPQLADKMCMLLGCNILDIYNKNEIDLIKDTKSPSKNKQDKLYYRLSVRLNRCNYNCLKSQEFKQLGYRTIKEWIEECMSDLKKEQRHIRSKSHE